jgi:mono/diheme cytochrome c family protein
MNSVKNILFLFFATAALFLTTSCGPSGNKPNVELIQDMMESPANKTQEYDDYFSDRPSAARVPPDNTIPIGFERYRWGANVELAAKENRNPMSGDFSESTLKTGQKYYEIHCGVCHGNQGRGEGPVADKMPLKPPSLLTEKIRGWSDGHVYHVITMGQGVMGPYASHIPQKYRWQVVNYIRQLQKSN